MFLFQVHLVTLYFRREKAQNALKFKCMGGERVSLSLESTVVRFLILGIYLRTEG